MSDFALTARSPLDGHKRDYDGTAIAEVCDRAVVSIATPTGGEGQFSKAIVRAFGTQAPMVGQSTTSNHRNARFLGMARQQIFVIFDDPGTAPVEAIAAELGETAYLVDQSDSWVSVSISGTTARAALERICPIDLHQNAFAVGQVARTLMDHLAVIVVREGPDAFLLMSPRSSARCFLQALETSCENIT